MKNFTMFLFAIGLFVLWLVTLQPVFGLMALMAVLFVGIVEARWWMKRGSWFGYFIIIVIVLGFAANLSINGGESQVERNIRAIERMMGQ